MKKRITLIVSTISVVLIIAMVASTLANNGYPLAADTSTGYGGYVLLQLPSPSTPTHPYDIRFAFRHFDPSSINGEEDYLGIYVWCANYPGGSRFVWIGGLTDEQAGLDFVKAIYTPYVGAKYMQLVSDDELVITKEGNVVTLTLNKDVPFTINEIGKQYLNDLSFTLPKMTLTFRAFDEAYTGEEGPTTLAAPLTGAGWTVLQEYTRKPAWIEASIPAIGWLGSTVMHAEGFLNMKFIETWTPPPA